MTTQTIVLLETLLLAILLIERYIAYTKPLPMPVVEYVIQDAIPVPVERPTVKTVYDFIPNTEFVAHAVSSTNFAILAQDINDGMMCIVDLIDDSKIWYDNYQTAYREFASGVFEMFEEVL